MEEDTSTRQSSKLSLGSSPSVLSADEQLDGDGPLTPTDKLQDDDDEDDDDDDDLSALNSILQAGSPGSLSNEEVSDEEEEDTHTEQDSASPLSSVPDDFPLSRSASPELPLLQPLPVSIPPVLDEDEEEEEEVVVEKKKSVRKRRSKDSETPSPTKKTKAATIATTAATNATTTAAAAVALVEEKSEEAVKKRRASRSITNHILTDPPSSRPRRRQSRQDEVKVEEKLIQHDDEIMQEITVPKQEEIIEKEASFDHLQKMDTLQENADCEDKAMNEAQDNDDHDYQQRHKEALDALTHIEVEFARLRDKMYEEKMSELNEEAIMIANGTHPELVTLMAEIEEKKGKRIHSAEAWRKHQHANFRQQFEGFEYQANIHFISQKNALRRNLLSSINGKRWNIEDERTKLNDPSRTDRVFPDGREMVAHKREQKEETGELQDIKEAVGFPMAPNPTGLSLQDVEQDLKILGIKP